MNLQEINVSEINPYKLNAKKHPEKQIDGIAESIRRFGFTQPVVIDSEGTIIIGHGRLEAAKKVGLKKVPCVRRDDLNHQEIKALRLVDNRIAETGWDRELISLDFKDIEFNFEPFNISFDDLIIEDVKAGLVDEDEVPQEPEKPLSKEGDVYKLGSHKVMCGDSTVATHVESLLAKVEPHLMVTDPPYGVDYQAEWRSKIFDPETKKRKTVRATGKVKNDDKADWREAWALFPGQVAYVWHAAIFSGVVQESLEACEFDIRSQIVWAKNQMVLSRGHYHWQHEPCWYAVKKGSKGFWSGDRKQTTLWQIQKPLKSETGHSTQKPVECMRRPILNNSSPGQAVYDPFLGSGSTLIAAEETGRACFGMELNPAYVDVIIKRWENFTGKKAELVNG